MEKEHDFVETEFGSFHAIKDDLATRQLKQYSAHTRNEIAMLASMIREGDTVLDIGAHIGSFAIPIAKRFPDRVNIFSFEPQNDIFPLLEKNVEINKLGNQITRFNGLVSDEVKSFSAPVVVDGNSMDAVFLPSKKAKVSEEEQSDISVFVIDQMINEGDIPENVNVIKIDTEGAERTVLNSCQNLIRKKLPVIYGEINVPALARFKTSPKDIEKYLYSFGYHFFRNIGHRNSDNDDFVIAKLNSLRDGGRFYDFLAVHPNSDRYPSTQETFKRPNLKPEFVIQLQKQFERVVKGIAVRLKRK